MSKEVAISGAKVPDSKPPHAASRDDEPRGNTTATVVDIEHAPVQDDPRHWSRFRKNFSLFLISAASMIAGLAGNIQNPAVEEMEEDLPATSAQFSLSLSLFILVQGVVPLLWCAISEVKGRKLVYLVSLAFFTIASIIVALSKNIGLVIAFRAIQAAGSSAVIAIGAATLADIFEPAERGTKMGIYYIAPLLGPAIGPIIGGGLTAGLGWRSIFWFLCIVSGASWLSFLLFFRDTFRKERSLTYQNVLKQRLRGKKGTGDDIISPSTTAPASTTDLHHDLEKANENAKCDAPAAVIPQLEVELSLKDVNPFKPIGTVLRRINNLAILFASGLMFALSFMISYTCARTLSRFYNYDALMIGVITITYGLGCVAGSLLGGRWSDYKLAQLKEANGGKSYPEMRLKSTTLGIWMLPPCIIGFGWVCDRRVHIAALCVFLFVAGFFTIWTYASALAYIVDANNGRSATAVATNSAFRGVSAFVATEIAVPLQDSIGDGWLYTIWGVMMMVSGALILLVAWKGEEWRARAEEREAQEATSSEQK
ncbi:MFS general substrate transporter [Macrolepiota fuliginosa MF-IS2]|uniref:MFS general substrate transporter n=1 Tax=Macrolepiota fuliginosa MF-IS2 TaxID=1400762 RepID=A0A9P5XAM5_9AGAR|nr:MFS general substrate transporter [Macrolepiota fuliginosa MF-IS2]